MTGRKAPKGDKKVTPLPSNSANLIKATLLGFVADNCSKFDVEYSKAMMVDKKGLLFVKIFRYPFATYLTSEMFSCISYFMANMQKLRTESKQKETLAAQHCFLYIL